MADQKGIVESFCDMEKVEEGSRQKMLNYASKVTDMSTLNVFVNPICVENLPEDYQNAIVEETVFRAVSERIRIFRDIDPLIQLSLAFQFKVDYIFFFFPFFLDTFSHLYRGAVRLLVNPSVYRSLRPAKYLKKINIYQQISTRGGLLG